MSYRHTLVAAAVSAVLLSACSSDSTVPSVTDQNPAGVDSSDRRLKNLETSEAFIDALRAGLIAQANQYNQPDQSVITEDVVLASQSPVAPPGGAPQSESSDSSAGLSGGSSAGNEVTSTNVQEQGVDEQDWVKISSDGQRLFVLNSEFPNVFPVGGPVVIEPGIEPEIEPAPVGVPVEDIAQTSMLAPQSYQTTLRIMQLDEQTPDSSSLRDLSVELNGRYAEGFYLYENGDTTTAYLSASGSNFWGNWAEPTAFAGLDSVITRVDVSDPATAAVTGAFQLDGQIVSSRRIGKHLFFASRFYPNVPGEQPWNQSPEQWRQAVNNTDIASLLPHYSNDGSENTLPLFDPASCFVSNNRGADIFYSPDIITLAVVDLETLQLTDSECYLGASETLYASPDAVFLATTQYDYSVGPVTEDGVVIDIATGAFPGDVFWSDPRVDTDIHQFDIEDGELVYAGTGTVDGHLGWNALRKPFRMSEKDGYLRVATFNDQQGMDQSPILMSVLQSNGSGQLENISRLPNSSEPAFIGKPGEQLYASRFLGDRAYLVTFRQTDPLYVIDLSNPAAPRIAGELEIEGYSDYLHPVGEDHLLGIGKDAVAAPDNFGDGRGALVQGIKLSLFDVSNPAAPVEVQSVRVGQRGTESQALADHRAITVQAATDEHPLRVSFGIDVNGEASPGETVPGTSSVYYNWSYTGLHAFDIKTGADAGIVPRGALVVQRADTPDDVYFRRYETDRAVMVNDAVFYIRGAGVYAAHWDNLANPSPRR